MAKVGKKLISWSTYDILKAEVDYRLENQEKDNIKTEEEIWSELGDASYLITDEWDFVKDHLTEILNKKNANGYWKVVVKNFGWSNKDGYKYINVDTGEDFLREILPDTDCTFSIFNYGRGLAIQNSHHDSPCGNEWYYITPCAESTYEKCS